ncbi:MAG: hypothetical protein DRQ62_14675, partial [Gammaproteobacteria bacterium]
MKNKCVIKQLLLTIVFIFSMLITLPLKAIYLAPDTAVVSPDGNEDAIFTTITGQLHANDSVTLEFLPSQPDWIDTIYVDNVWDSLHVNLYWTITIK